MIKIVGAPAMRPHGVSQLLFGSKVPGSLSNINYFRVYFASAPDFGVLVNVIPEIDEYEQANYLLASQVEIRILSEQDMRIRFAITGERVGFFILGHKEQCYKILAFQALEQAHYPMFVAFLGGENETEEINSARQELEKVMPYLYKR